MWNGTIPAVKTKDLTPDMIQKSTYGANGKEDVLV